MILVATGVVTSLEPIATVIHQKPRPQDKHIYNHYPSKVSTKTKHIYNHYPSKVNTKAKHIYNHYPSYIVNPPYIKSKYPNTSYIKFIHAVMFMITTHCSSTIHQKSVPQTIIHQVHDPHESCIASSNLESWRCYFTTS
jgi:hypothetical protein